jgi:hypothetical protein
LLPDVLHGSTREKEGCGAVLIGANKNCSINGIVFPFSAGRVLVRKISCAGNIID